MCDFYQDCSKIPISRKCLEYCLERILRTATVEEKQLILGISQDLAYRILWIYSNYTVYSFREIENHLTDEQQEQLITKFIEINQFQLNYFRRSRSERKIIIDEIKNLGLENDSEFAIEEY